MNGNVTEIVDSWVKSQREFMENAVKAQQEAVERWLEATRKAQEAVMGLKIAQEGPAKEVFALYNTWMTTMVSSTKAFADESGKIQETWRAAVEKQMEASREMVKKIAEYFPQAAEKK